MQAKLMLLLAAAVVFLVLPSGSPAIAQGEAFIVLPGEAPRYGGQQGREADITELLATAKQTGGVLGIFRQTIAPKSGPPTHLHAMEAEFCYVVSGQFNFKLGEREHIPLAHNGSVPIIEDEVITLGQFIVKIGHSTPWTEKSWPRETRQWL